MPESSLDFLFHPESVAIVGASEGVAQISGSYVQHLVSYGYKGKIYPVNPRRPAIFGVRAYPDLNSIPGNIDYVINCIALENTPDLLAECHKKGVKAVHIFSGRAAETGRKEAVEMEQTILKVARHYGIRLLGPNCLGIYCPEAGLACGWDFPREPGDVGAAAQSGGISTDLVRFGALRGLRFSKVVSYGNALDINECDLLEYLASDPRTRVILCYVEGVKDGRRYFRTLRAAAQQKPVIVFKGGRTGAGNLAAASHTASLSGSASVWSTVIKQAGAIQANTFEEWLDLGVAFSLVPPIKGLRAGITGGSGGLSVLIADELEQMGFTIPPLPPDIRQKIREKAPLIWDWVGNPADLSIMRGTGITNKEVLTLMAEHPDFDFLLAHVPEAFPTSQDDFVPKVNEECESYIQIASAGIKPLVVLIGDRSIGINEISNWRWKLFAEIRTKLVAARIAFFTTPSQAAKALKVMIGYYQRKTRPAVSTL